MTDELFSSGLEAKQRIVSTRPISFTSESIYGIEKGLKTETRRVIYPQPKGKLSPAPGEWLSNKWSQEDGQIFRSPYGTIGDRLWVREVWARVEPYLGVGEEYDLPVARLVEKNPVLLEYWRKRVIFLADYPGKEPEECGRGATDNKWRGPVTMPKWASRRLLEVTEVRAERVQEISDQDIQAEGLELVGDYRSHWRARWDSINGRKHPWAENPWEWAISFKRIGVSGETGSPRTWGPREAVSASRGEGTGPSFVGCPI